MNFIFVSICILKKKNKILVTKRLANKYFGEFWEFPGGKLEKKEDFKDAVEKADLTEESLKVALKKEIGQGLVTVDKEDDKVIVTVGAVVSDIQLNCVAAVLLLPAESVNLLAATSTVTLPSLEGVSVAV